MKESIRAAADALLVAATSVVAVVCAYTLTQSDRANRPPASKQLDPTRVATVVVHRTDCDAAPFHFIVGNGVLYGDGEIVETEAWASRTPYPGLPEPDARRRTVGVGVVTVGRDGSTAAQAAALEALASKLGGVALASHCFGDTIAP